MHAHFYINVTLFDVLASEVASVIFDYFMNFGPVQHVYIVKPNQSTIEDFTLGIEGALYGINMENANYAKSFLLSETKVNIPKIGFVTVFPGSMGEDMWIQHQKERNYLQGFFFVGNDIVDFQPDCLCYFVSLPKGSFSDRVSNEIASHGIPRPIDIIKNPLEEKCIMRLQFSDPNTVINLQRMCLKIHNKPILVLPCKDRTPVEELYMPFQVMISGYNHTVSPGELLRNLTNNFGPVVEIVLSQFVLVMFQTLKAAESCVKRQEITIKRLKIRFDPVTKPYRLTGRVIHKGKYSPDPPIRPLELVPAPYTFLDPK